jgi:malonyl-CoA O-methyltransferase
MNLDKHRLGHNFGRQAAHYDRYALVQQRLAEELVESLAGRRQQFHRILEIGCGTGYLTGLLRQAYPQAHLTALDLAPAAVETARARLAGQDIHWMVADGEQAVPGHFDLITASSVFQWFSQPRRACRLYGEHLQPGGLLAFTTLGPLTFRELAASFDLAGKLFPDSPLPAIPARNFVAGGQWGNFLEEAGFSLVRVAAELRPEGYPDMLAFLKAVRGMGATSTRPAFVPRKLLAAAMAHYDRRFRHNGTIEVTYEVIRVTGEKPLAGRSA